MALNLDFSKWKEPPPANIKSAWLNMKTSKAKQKRAEVVRCKNDLLKITKEPKPGIYSKTSTLLELFLILCNNLMSSKDPFDF